jgi:iron complex outermembrane receptor protein
MGKIAGNLLMSAVALTAMAVASPQAIAAEEKQEYHLPAQDLGTSLRAIGSASHREIMFQAQSVEGRRAPALDGTFSASEAVAILLRDSGLVASVRGRSILVKSRFRAEANDLATKQADNKTSDIVVTGSFIRGSSIASPSIKVSSEEIEESGYANLGDFARSIPQNFSGGQNPGIGIGVPVANGENLGSGSSINLRGLGQDATLTLLNGHRVANGGQRQSIDVSAIPIDAIDRIEIVTDGSSALYGSDAVSGVANIILKQDYQGLTTSVRYGLATEGGDRQQQYNVVAGTRWHGGGAVVAYEFGRDTAITASQRSYAATTNPGLTLYPFIKHHSTVVNLHQDLLENVQFRLDGGYNRRWDRRGYALGTDADAPAYMSRVQSSSFFIAPSIQWSPLSAWLVSLSGMYGEDRARLHQQLTESGITSTTIESCACNSAVSIEFKADGPLFELPGGAVKIAFGGGYRRDKFQQELAYYGSPVDNFSANQDDRYGFAELNIPLIGKSQNVPFIRSLTLSAAARYDDYPGIDKVITPKFGVVYAPNDQFDIRGTWGRSFKAPTLYQRYSPQSATIYSTGILGGSSYASGSTAILLLGGRSDLSPERADTWTTTIGFHPTYVPGLKIEATYFSTRYRDRVIMPIAALQQSLSDPVYASLVTLNPTGTAIDYALMNKAVYNYSGAIYDPANVVAIVDDRNFNIARQKLHGFDFSAEYRYEMARGEHVTVSAYASYLDSEQKLLPTVDTMPLAGTYYNPPHFRSRVGISWDSSRLQISGFVNYIGGVKDTRYTSVTQVSGMATMDIASRLRFDGGTFSGVEIYLSAQNITNASPDKTRTQAAYDAPYDTTNYSPIGRLLSIGVRKNW